MTSVILLFVNDILMSRLLVMMMQTVPRVRLPHQERQAE